MTGPRSDVQVWIADPREREWGAASDVLDHDERRRAARFRFREDREAYVAAHVLLRATLSRHAHLDPHEWRFEAGRGRAPRISGPRPAPLEFSLTHARGLVGCAVTFDRRVGVDIEGVTAAARSLELAPSVCAPEELAMLQREGPREAARRFCTLWTLKEAALKAMGIGLGHPWGAARMRLLSFDVEGAGVRPHRVPGDGPWSFATWWSQTGGHAISVAVEGEGGPLHLLPARPPTS
jgi:4'-phosphopantetheinyl transferase